MTRVLLIHNPYAARTKQPALSAVQSVFCAAGWSVDAEATRGPGDAAELARKGVEDGVDIVAVYGGDGTTIQAVGGLGNRGVPIGLIPGGTGNLLAANLGISRNPIRAARMMTRGAPRAIDLGRLTSRETARHFAVACGAGFDAEIMTRTSGSAKSRWGMAAYVTQAVKLLRDSQVVDHRITIDGTTMDAPAATVLVANCGMIIPPFLRLKHDIRPDDGLLDVVVVNAGGLVEALAVIGQFLLGRTDSGRGWQGRRVRYARGRCIRLETDVPRPAQLDGEPAGTTPFTADIIPGGMQVIVPKIA